jgi:hypothetical protein
VCCSPPAAPPQLPATGTVCIGAPPRKAESGGSVECAFGECASPVGREPIATVVLLDKSFSYEFTKRLVQATAERTSEVRSRQSDRTREIAKTALCGSSYCSQQLKLHIIQLRVHRRAERCIR